MIPLRHEPTRPPARPRPLPIGNAGAVNLKKLCQGRRAAEALDDGVCRLHDESACSVIRYDSQQGVANSSTDARSADSYGSVMKLSPVNQWVAEALRRSGISQAELARRLTDELHREIDRAGVNKMTTGGRRVAADEMLAIEAITKVAAPSANVPKLVPMIDWVSAGKLAEPRSQIPVEDVPLLAFADLGRGDFFALKVMGDSMDRISPDNSVIVVNRAERQLIGGRYYVFSIRGETTYKMWHADPPYLAPYSTNPANQPIIVTRKLRLDVIGRVRRTVLDL